MIKLVLSRYKTVFSTMDHFFTVIFEEFNIKHKGKYQHNCLLCLALVMFNTLKT